MIKFVNLFVIIIAQPTGNDNLSDFCFLLKKHSDSQISFTRGSKRGVG